MLVLAVARLPAVIILLTPPTFAVDLLDIVRFKLADERFACGDVHVVEFRPE